MVAKRGRTDRANVHTPYVTKLFKTVWQNSNRSSNFGCNWTSFHSNKNNNKNADARVWGNPRGDQKMDTSWGSYLICFCYLYVNVTVLYYYKKVVLLFIRFFFFFFILKSFSTAQTFNIQSSWSKVEKILGIISGNSDVLTIQHSVSWTVFILSFKGFHWICCAQDLTSRFEAQALATNQGQRWISTKLRGRYPASVTSPEAWRQIFGLSVSKQYLCFGRPIC